MPPVTENFDAPVLWYRDPTTHVKILDRSVQKSLKINRLCRGSRDASGGLVSLPPPLVHRANFGGNASHKACESESSHWELPTSGLYNPTMLARIQYLDLI
jgi:hypothetical protein